MKKLTWLRKILQSKAGKMVVVASALACSAVFMSICACADDPPAIDTTAIQTALTSGLQSGATTTISMMAAVAPYGITIFVAMLAVKYAKKFFNKISA